MNNNWEKQDNTETAPRVHCLVHPWFDVWEHEEFESYIHGYIDYIAKTTHDVLLLVSDGERFDFEQLEQFAYIDIIEAISLYLWLHDGGLGDLINIYDDDGNFSRVIADGGLTEEFYKWCDENIDMSELRIIADEWRVFKKDCFSSEYKVSEDERESIAASLREREEKAKVDLGIESIAHKAFQEFWPVAKRSTTYRDVGNKGRFFRIFQHAMRSLWLDRVREIFIRDGEDPDVLPIQPVSHFSVFQWETIATPLGETGVEAQVFNASESHTYGNAAQLKDDLTYKLSVTRHEKLKRQQPDLVLQDMWFNITTETKFVFFWEYRNRCVNNVLRVVGMRLDDLIWDHLYIGHDVLTLERPDNYVSRGGF